MRKMVKLQQGKMGSSQRSLPSNLCSWSRVCSHSCRRSLSGLVSGCTSFLHPAVRPPVHWEEMNNNLFTSVEPDAAEAAGLYIAHCDGGSRGNPGPSGYGAVIEDPQGRVAARLSKFLGVQTNNYAEYQGLLAVLGWALENGVRRLRVVSDSELMVRQMTGRYKVASPLLRPLWQDAKRLAARLDGIEMRHTLRGGNQEADRLANEAMDKGMGRGVNK